VSLTESSPGSAPRSMEPAAVSKFVTWLERSNLLPVAEKSWEGNIAAGDKLAAEATMNVGFVDFSSPGIETLSSSEGDILVVRWPAVTSAVGEKALWAVDSPTEITYVIQGNPDLFKPGRLTEFYEKLLLWDRPPTQLKRVDLAITGAAEGGQVVGVGEFIMTPGGIYYWGFGAIKKSGAAWIAVSMSKSNIVSYSPIFPIGSVGVPERFPPLRSRLSATSREGLLSEIGKGYGGGSAPYPRGRDAVVISEILSRGLVSESEIYEVLFHRISRGDVASAEIVNQRIGVLLGNVEARQELPVYAPLIASALGVGPDLGWMGDAVIGHLFAAVERNNLDFTEHALDLLKRERFATGALNYLSRHADANIVGVMAQMPLSPATAKARDMTLNSIKARLGN
jgi:hypothetical protein